jgi:ABC-2 type transport system permease protein
MLQKKIIGSKETISVENQTATITPDNLDSRLPPHNEVTNKEVDLSARPEKEFLLAYIWRTLGELRYAKFALASFVINNLRRRYQRSVLGFAWSLLNPLLMMMVLTGVFSTIFSRDPKTFAIFVFTGLLPWTFISESIQGGCSSITSAESFMKKVYIPKIFFPLVAVATEFINFALSLVSMMALGLLLNLQLHWTLFLLPAVMVLTFLFTFGVAIAMSVTTVYFRDIAHFTRVILSCFFYLTPIVYPISAVPEKHKLLFQLNPFTFFINLFRDVICNGTIPTWQEWAIPGAFAVVSLLVGFMILRHNERDIIFRL